METGQGRTGLVDQALVEDVGLCLTSYLPLRGMAKSEPGDPGQAGTYDPKTGGKFEPTTKAKPAPEHPKVEGKKAKSGKPKPPRPQPK